jgi:hypothetical protein
MQVPAATGTGRAQAHKACTREPVLHSVPFLVGHYRLKRYTKRGVMVSGQRPAQRRGRTIAMSDAEMDSFLGEQRTCRLATLGPGGPHVSPVWFVWYGGALWVYSLTRSQRWADLQRDPRVAAVIDAGHHYQELHGVEIEGEATVVGPVPRPSGENASEDPELDRPERLMAAKYHGGMVFPHDGRHAWLRIAPQKITSWDFRKLATLTGDR